MNISPTLVSELAKKDIAYEIVPHRFTSLSLNSANSAHVPVEKMVKPVVLEDEDGYVMALVPSNKHVKIRELNQLLDRSMGLTTEEKIFTLFQDCAPGAIPPRRPSLPDRNRGRFCIE